VGFFVFGFWVFLGGGGGGGGGWGGGGFFFWFLVGRGGWGGGCVFFSGGGLFPPIFKDNDFPPFCPESAGFGTFSPPLKHMKACVL